jgi:CO dehydrogenase/acetyl-CoA synthase alpha subunit
MPIDVLNFEYFVYGSLALLALVSAVNLKKLSTIKKRNTQILEQLTENVTLKEMQASLSKFESAFISSLVLMENNIISVVELESQKHQNKDEKIQLHDKDFVDNISKSPRAEAIPTNQKIDQAVKYAQNGFDSKFISEHLDLKQSLVNEIVRFNRPNSSHSTS